MAREVVRPAPRHRAVDRTFRGALAGALLAASFVVRPHAAHADAARETARRLFVEGVQRFQAGDYAAARERFAEADRTHHAPSITYNLARAEEKLGHAHEALEGYDAFVAESGTSGELAQAAALAAADLRARTSPTRIESEPSGARVRIDGRELASRTPTVVALPAGDHLVEVTEGSFTASRRVTAEGKGRALVVLLARGASDVSTPSGAAPPTPPPSETPPPRPAAPRGLVLNAGFAISPYLLFGATRAGAPNDRTVYAVVAGPTLGLGYAVTERFEVVVHGFASIGPEGKPSYAYGFGPGFSLRALPSLWLGASFLGGRLDTHLADARYDTDLVFGARLEAAYVVAETDYGQWTVLAEPSVLLTQSNRDNTCVFLPLGLGLRLY